MKQFRSTLILLVLALGIGGYIYFNERGPIAQEDSTELLRTQPTAVQAVALESGASGVQLRRDGDSWYVSRVEKGKTGDPVLADPNAVKTLLDSLQLVQSQATVDKPSDLKQYGLDKPTSKLTVDGKTLEFGTKPSFDTSNIYTKVGDTVALVPATLADNATKAFNDWRDKSLLQVKPDEVEFFSIKAPKVTADFKKQDDKWNLTAPVATAADSSTVSAFLSTLSTTQSTAWLDEKGKDLAKWQLDKPQATVTVGDATLKIGKKVSGGYAAQNSLSPAVFTVPESTFTQIDRPLKDWRNKRITDVSLADVTSLELTARGSTKSYQKADDKWQETGGKADDKVNGGVLDLLSSVTGWTAQDFVDKPGPDKDYGLDTPLATLKITAKDNYTLTVGEKDKKTYIRDGKGTVFQLGPEAASGLKSSLDMLIPPKKK
jgi:hypothetical protein